TAGQQAQQLAALRREIESERVLARTELERRAEVAQAARAELARREVELEASRAEAAQLGQKIREQVELASLRRDDLADERATAQKMAVRVAELERVLDHVRAQAQAAENRL